jgi:hypothetical protein
LHDRARVDIRHQVVMDVEEQRTSIVLERFTGNEEAGVPDCKPQERPCEQEKREPERDHEPERALVRASASEQHEQAETRNGTEQESPGIQPEEDDRPTE